MSIYDNEEWRPVKGYEGLYEVSNLGKVRSLHAVKSIILKQENRNGYKRVSLYKEGERHTLSVHRIVAETFIPNPENLIQVNHINEIKMDNRVENLEWCTNTYNVNYGTRNDRVSKKLSKPVGRYSLDDELLETYNSCIEASKKHNFIVGHICACCTGKRKTHKGFKWKYL